MVSPALFISILIIFYNYSKKDPHFLVRGIPMLRYMMTDRNVNVEKRVIVCFMQLYRIALVVSDKMR